MSVERPPGTEIAGRNGELMVMNAHCDKHKTPVKDFRSEVSFTMRGFASSIMPLLTSVDEYFAATGKEKRYGRREKSRTLYPSISSDV